MGGPLGIVHVTTLNGSVARLVSCRERTRGGHPLTRGCPPPIRLPSRTRAVLPIVVVIFAAVCPPFFCCVSGGYALSLSVAPCFLIVYAPAMRSVAYYALGWGCSCAHLTVRRCRAGRVVVCGGVARVWAWGSSGVLLGCERGRVSVSLVFFFEETTMPERGGTKGAHPGSTRMLLNERTIRHHRVNAGVNKREIRKQGEAVTCR